MNCDALSQKQRYDVTECVICADVYNDPRQLPCLHTFCMACIEGWRRDKRDGDTLTCPLCRRKFTFSDCGLATLPKDRFIGKMLMVRRLTSQVASHLQCDSCRHGGSTDSPHPARSYCIDCCESLCKPCAVDHQGNPCHTGHEIVKLRKRRPSRPEKYLSKLPAAPCNQHPDQPREMYCVDCSVTTCRRCLAREHKSHKAGEVESLGNRLRDRIDVDVGRLALSVERCRAEMERLRTARDEFENRYTRCQKIYRTPYNFYYHWRYCL